MGQEIMLKKGDLGSDGAVKSDANKARYDLIPATPLDLLARIYTMGAKKYADRNWEKGMAWGRVFAAIMRHLWAFWRGEDLDPESGLPHPAHAANLLAQRFIVSVEHVAVSTSYLSDINMMDEYSKELPQLTQNFTTNCLIVGRVIEQSRNLDVRLVLSDRKSHCDTLWAMLVAWGHKPTILTGDVPDAERKQVVQDFNAGKIKILISTMQLVSEGIDVAGITTLFPSTPIKWSARVLQTVGHAMRQALGKSAARIIDFVDISVPVLYASYMQRALTLKRLRG